MEAKKKDLQKLSVWEKLEHTRDVFNEVLDCTSKGLPISATEKELIYQELITAIGAIATFSECLASGELHEQL